MLGKLIFDLPFQFASKIADGSAVRIGTLVKDVATGRILGHVQETGLIQQLMTSSNLQPFSQLPIPTDPVSAVASVGNLVSSVYANIQLKQLKSLVESMQILQYANLGFTLAGIGVSAVGFAVVTKRLKTVENSIAALSAKMDQKFQELHDRELRHCFSRIQTQYESASQALRLKNPVGDWLGIEQKLALESGILRTEIQHFLAQEKFDPDWFAQMTQALTLSNAIRMECLLRSNELAAAHHTAIIIGDQYSDLLDGISVNDLANKSMKNYSGSQSGEISHYNFQKSKVSGIVKGCRDITESALSRPLLITFLSSKGIAGGEYLKAIESRNEDGILVLIVD